MDSALVLHQSLGVLLFALIYLIFVISFMENNRVKRKKPSALPSILSLASVMFILGLLGVSIIGFNGLGKYWLENSSVDVYFHSEVTDEYVKDFQKQMKKKSWVHDVQYISKEQAIEEMGQKYDPNFMSYVETVSLPLSIEIYPKAEYANTKFLSEVSHFFKQKLVFFNSSFSKRAICSWICWRSFLFRYFFRVLGVNISKILVYKLFCPQM